MPTLYQYIHIGEPGNPRHVDVWGTDDERALAWRLLCQLGTVPEDGPLGELASAVAGLRAKQHTLAEVSTVLDDAIIGYEPVLDENVPTVTLHRPLSRAWVPTWDAVLGYTPKEE